jgi:osmotically-inducible protein OsmY
MTATRPELARLGIRVDGGTVRLSGQVASFYLRQLALSAARRVAGVQCVVDEIEVPILQVRNYQPASGFAEPISTQH